MELMKPKQNLVASVFTLLALFVSSAFPLAATAHPPQPGDEQPLGTPVSVEPGDVSITYTGCGGVTAPVVNAAYEQEVVELVNAERADEGLPPLKRVAALDRAARYYATDMAQDNYFPSNHNTYDRSGGTLVQVCTWDARISSYYSGPQALAENIAAGQPTPEDVMAAWMGSPGHKDNILHESVWEIGVGYYVGGGAGPYWVQDFGRRRDVYPIVINREAATTDSVSVSLYIYGAGTWSEMRLRNDDGSWTAWQPFQSTLSWTLNGQAGERTVWVELRDGSQTTLSSDTITLSQSAPSLSLSTHSLSFLAELGGGGTRPASAAFTVSNTGGGSLSWTASDDAGWLILGSSAGDAPSTVDVWVDTSGGILNSLGEKTATITVDATDPEATNSPQTISVTLNVVEELFATYLPIVLK
jgi:uncharacterized protein YkwD